MLSRDRISNAPFPPKAGISPSLRRFWLSLVALFLMTSWGASAASVTLAWDPSPAEGITGYKVYYGTNSGRYNRTVTLGNTHEAKIDNLQTNTPYFFVVTALTASSLESPPSPEIRVQVPDPDAPSLTLSRNADGLAVVSGSGKPGAMFNLQTSPNLTQWTTLRAVTFDEKGRFQYTDSGSAALPIRFYRLSQPIAPPTFSATRNQTGQTVLTIAGTPGTTSQIQSSSDLIHWTTLTLFTLDMTGTFAYADAASGAATQRFYRLRPASATPRLALRRTPQSLTVVTGTGPAGSSFDLQVSSNLTSWTTVITAVFDPNGTIQYTDPASATLPQRFYRLRPAKN